MKPTDTAFLFGFFDLLVLAAVVLLDLLLWRYRLPKKMDWKVVAGCLLLFVVVIPMYAARIEAANAKRESLVIDGFELLYVWLRWPLWWIIGTVELLVLHRLSRLSSKPS